MFNTKQVNQFIGRPASIQSLGFHFPIVAALVLSVLFGGNIAGADAVENDATASTAPAQTTEIQRYQPEGACQRAGMSPEGVEAIVAYFGSMIGEQKHPGAQLAVYRNGELVLELAAGVDGNGNPIQPDSLLNILSTTKALTAMVIHMLHDKGLFSYDDPVAKYWPEFAQNGKEMITIRQVLSHRAGLAPSLMIGYKDWPEWSKPGGTARLIEAMTPLWEPGTENGYHGITYGHITDELARRWTGKNIGELLRAEFCDPLGIKDVYIGLPESAYPRFAHYFAQPWAQSIQGYSPPPGGEGYFFNSYDILKLSLPFGNGVARARDLARIMNVYAFEGRFGGKTFFSKETFNEAVTPTNGPDEQDRIFRANLRWGLGLMLRSTALYGATHGPRTCGHLGGRSSVSWADPDLRLTMSFISTRAPKQLLYQQLSDTIRAACVL